ncbi:ArsR/SmtB family transcription factor [Oceanicola sp. S124]|uniref:ArsR/SmtB family transcription factor n=1 Tax=Oceanicola sp. S124 TaxID=1042378 RepID=UPI000255792D|nr:helix-turn-helix transcriptional regulator [Oceanicola sp. S124]
MTEARPDFRQGPGITRVAALLGDPSRAAMAEALMSGMALTANELAQEAGIAASTASGHLAQLLHEGLLSVTPRGRHRYYRIAGPEVASALEGLMGLVEAKGPSRCRPGPHDPALRHARSCYDHLAGALAVQMHDSLAARGLLRPGPEGLVLSETGASALAPLLPGVRLLAGRQCLDWSERRMHLAGPLGRALLLALLDQGWARRGQGREIALTRREEAGFAALFPLPQGSGAVW